MPTIALVDDDRNILTSVSIALEAEGYRIMTYTDGASALDGFRTSPPDLAILDIKMPRMDGMELLRRLRQLTDMPVIFLTSKDEEIDELFGLKMGADDYIAKPFSQRLVVERVKAVLRRFQPKDAANPAAEAARVLERGKLRLDPDDGLIAHVIACSLQASLLGTSAAACSIVWPTCSGTSRTVALAILPLTPDKSNCRNVSQL